MKKTFLNLMLLAVIAIVAYVNYDVTKESDSNYNLSFMEIEALADNEWNDWNEWLTQGLTKDEREWVRPCPSEEYGEGYGEGSYGDISIGGGGSHGQVNPNGRNEITCPYGNSNCTEVNCD